MKIIFLHLNQSLKKFKSGTHLISIESNSLIPEDVVNIEVSWVKEKLTFKYYKIK